jgi:hypothetical protein
VLTKAICSSNIILGNWEHSSVVVHLLECSSPEFDPQYNLNKTKKKERKNQKNKPGIVAYAWEVGIRRIKVQGQPL